MWPFVRICSAARHRRLTVNELPPRLASHGRGAGGASEGKEMKEGRVRRVLIISAHLIRITGRDRGDHPATTTASARQNEKSA